MSKLLQEWGDFEVMQKGKTARELYDGYKVFKEIFDSLPKKELIDRGWIRSEDDIESMMPMLSDIYAGRDNVLFRKTNSANDLLCSAWLAKVSSYAKVVIATKNIPEYSGIDKGYLSAFTKNSVDESIISKIPQILEEVGIIVVYERALPGMKLDGAVYRAESGHPVIGLSFRYHRLDYYWFTLLHELAHVALHFEQLEQPILDDLDDEENSEIIELQANRLAKSSFVERKLWRNCEPKYKKDPEAVINFANQVGVHPAIIAGFLRKEEGAYEMYSDIVNRIDVRQMVFDYD